MHRAPLAPTRFAPALALACALATLMAAFRPSPLRAASLDADAASRARISLTAGGYVDEDGGEGYDLDLGLQLDDAWSLGIGGGRSSASSDASSELGGTAWRASAGWQGERFGLGAQLRQWNDADEFASRTLGLDVSMLLPAGFGLTALYSQRDLTVEYIITGTLGRALPASIGFEAHGVGAELTWMSPRWTAVLRALSYDYDRRLPRVRAAALAPTTAGFPRLQSLTDSVLTRAFGIADRELGASLERYFGRSSLRISLSRTREALLGESVDDASAALRYAFTPRLAAEATLGTSSGDVLGSAAYGGVSITLRN